MIKNDKLPLKIFNRFVEICADHDVSIHAGAKMIGIHPSSPYQWRASNNALRVEVCVNMYNVFGVNINWLLTGEGDKYIR